MDLPYFEIDLPYLLWNLFENYIPRLSLYAHAINVMYVNNLFIFIWFSVTKLFQLKIIQFRLLTAAFGLIEFCVWVEG